MGEKRNTWVYELKDGRETVYFGITNDPVRRIIEHNNKGKSFTSAKLISVALTRESADIRESWHIYEYEMKHKGNPPRYNIKKTGLWNYVNT